jgi:hypothetical protein
MDGEGSGGSNHTRYHGVRHQPWGKLVVEMRDWSGRGVGVWQQTFETGEEAYARAAGGDCAALAGAASTGLLAQAGSSALARWDEARGDRSAGAGEGSTVLLAQQQQKHQYWDEGGSPRNVLVGGGNVLAGVSGTNKTSSVASSSVAGVAGANKNPSVASLREGAADQDLEAGTVQIDGDGDVSIIWRILQSFVPGAALSRTQVQSLLFLIACLILTLDLAALCYGQAAGPFFGLYPAARYIILAVILALAVVGLVIAFLLSCSCSDGRRSLALAKHLMPFAFILFLVTVAVGSFSIPFMSSKAYPVR